MTATTATRQDLIDWIRAAEHHRKYRQDAAYRGVTKLVSGAVTRGIELGLSTRTIASAIETTGQPVPAGARWKKLVHDARRHVAQRSPSLPPAARTVVIDEAVTAAAVALIGRLIMPVERITVLDKDGRPDPIRSVTPRLMAARVILFATLAVDQMQEARLHREGVPVPIGRLAARLGMSHNTVRQALAGLEALDWIRFYRRTKRGVAVYELTDVDLAVVSDQAHTIDAFRDGALGDELARVLAAVDHPTWRHIGWPNGLWTTAVAQLAGLNRAQAIMLGAGHDQTTARRLLAELTAAGHGDLAIGLDHHPATAGAAERAHAALVKYEARLAVDAIRMGGRQEAMKLAALILVDLLGENLAYLPPQADEARRRAWAYAVRDRLRSSGLILAATPQRALAEVVKARLIAAGETAEVASLVGLRVVGLDVSGVAA